jgi:predicted alpha-1,2-mannosidase
MTLDYAYDDYCAATVAGSLGHKDDAKILYQRSKNYRNVWNPAAGFMCGRNRDGSWVPFNPYEWGGAYVEGGPWQSTWAVPHDPDGLMTLMGGRKNFLSKLDGLLETPPVFHAGSYVGEIHEMTEMALADFGQYAHSNQPVHGVLWLYTLAKAPERNRLLVKRVLAGLYNSGSRGFCGDEDNGEMSAWYVFGAMGIFPFCPGNGRLVTGGLLFDRAVIRPADSPEILVEPLQGGAVPEFNGQPLPDFEIRIRDLLEGGTLQIPAL